MIEVSYEELPAVFDQEEAMAEGAPSIHDVTNNVAMHFKIERGDVEAALAAADVVVDETFEGMLQWQTPMEPTGCLAVYEAGKFTLWANVSGLFRACSSPVRLPSIRARSASSSRRSAAVSAASRWTTTTR
jgi:CO/xanthine dehydrogenase Mo-binding subunit